MLMAIHPEERYRFLRRVTFGARPNYRITAPIRPQDDEKRRTLKRQLPAIYAAYCVEEANRGIGRS